MADQSVTIWIRIRDQFTKQFQSMKAEVTKMSGAMGAFGDVGRTAMTMAGNAARWVAGQMKWALLAAVALGTYMSKQFVQGVVKAGAELESWRMRLGQVMGPQAAESAISWLRDFDDLLAGGLDAAAEAFVRLRATGVKNIKETMVAARDAAFTMNMDFGTLIHGFITMMPRTWRQVGVSIDQSGKTAVMTLGAMRVETAKTTEAMRAGLLQLLQKQFGGAMEKAKGSWKGLTMLMTDAWDDFKVSVAEAGVFDFIKAGLKSTFEWIQKLKSEGKLDEWAKGISDSLISVALLLAESIKFAMKYVATMHWIGTYIKSFGATPTIPEKVWGMKIGAPGGYFHEMSLQVNATKATRAELEKEMVSYEAGTSTIDEFIDRWKAAAVETRNGGRAARETAGNILTLKDALDEVADSSENAWKQAVQHTGESLLGMNDEDIWKMKTGLAEFRKMTKPEELMKNRDLLNFAASHPIFRAMNPELLAGVEELLLKEVGITDERVKQMQEVVNQKTLEQTLTDVVGERKTNEEKITEQKQEQLQLMEIASRAEAVGYARRIEGHKREVAEAARKELEAKAANFDMQRRFGATGMSTEEQVLRRKVAETSSAAVQATEMRKRMEGYYREVALNPTINVNVSPEDVGREVSNALTRMIAASYAESMTWMQNGIEKLRRDAEVGNAASLQVQAAGGM